MLENSFEKRAEARFEHGTAGWEVPTLPLCFATFKWTFVLVGLLPNAETFSDVPQISGALKIIS